MIIDTDMVISITDANQNFSRATKIADKHGSAIIFKNNRPKYQLTNLDFAGSARLSDDETVLITGKRILSKHIEAFKELSK